MSKTIRGLPEWAILLLKVLFVMIFPLSVEGTNLLQFIFLPTSGLLFLQLENHSVWAIHFFTLIAILSIVLRNFIIGIVIAFPGIYYSYKLSRIPANRSYWKRGLGAAFAIYFLTFGILYYLIMNMYSSEIFWGISFWVLLQRIGQYTTLVMGVFIILPLVQRQAVIIGSPSELHHYYSTSEIESKTKLNISREKILGAIFWLVLCFGPMMLQQRPHFVDGARTTYLSFMFTYLLSVDVNRQTGSLLLHFFCNTNDFAIIPIYALMSTFHFAFVRDAYRYLRKIITRQRLLSMAVFSSIFPIILSSGMYVPMMGYYFLMPIPFPLLQVVGLILVKYHRPIVDQVDRVWNADRTKMWWEKDDREYPKEVHIDSTPEKPHRHREELIIVPVTYLFISRIRQLNRRLRR